MRKVLFLGTGGLSGMAGVRANSKKERTAKAAEKQVRLQEQAMRPELRTPRASTPLKYRIACAFCGEKVPLPMGHNVPCPRCSELLDVRRDGGIPGIRPVRALRPDTPTLDSRGAL
jgi:hypothetical protein